MAYSGHLWDVRQDDADVLLANLAVLVKVVSGVSDLQLEYKLELGLER